MSITKGRPKTVFWLAAALMAALLAVALLAPSGEAAASGVTRDASKDFSQSLLQGAGNNNPWGVWSDGNTMYVVDHDDKKAYAYKMSDRTRDSGKDIDIARPVRPSAEKLAGMWGDGRHIWVVDDDSYRHHGDDLRPGWVLSYRLSDKAWIKSQTFASHYGFRHDHRVGRVDSQNHPHGGPQGIWMDDRHIFITDGLANKIFIHRRSDHGYAGVSIDVHDLVGSGDPVGIWSDGTTLWFADHRKDKVFALRLSDYSRDEAKDFDLTDGNHDARGMWSDGTTMWISDHVDDKVYAYDISSISATPAKPKSALDPRNTKPSGLWSNGTVTWVADWHGTTRKLFAYGNGAWQHWPGFDIHLATANSSPHGVWGKDDTIWVSDWNQSKLFAYSIQSNSHVPDKDIPLDPENTRAVDIWGDGRLIWVLDAEDKKSYVYSLEGGRAADLDRDYDPGINTFGMWSDSFATWVSDANSRKLLAYRRLPPAERLPKLDVQLHGNNGSPRGVANIGGKLVVLETDSTEVFSYYYPEALSLSISPTQITEDGGEQEVTVTVEYLGYRPPDTDTGLTLELAHETTSGDDINLRPLATTALTLPGGERKVSTTLKLTPIDDSEHEGTEQISVFVKSALGERILTADRATLYLVNDDPPPLAGLTAGPVAADTTKLKVSWSAVTDATGYGVEIKSTGDYVDVTRSDDTATEEIITGLTAATTYTVRVTATGADGELGKGEATGATLPAMSAVTVDPVDGSKTELDVSWPAVAGAVGYRVEYRKGAADYAEVARDDATATSETIEDLTAGTAYDVRVTARHNIGGTEQDGASATGSGTTIADMGEVTVTRVDNSTTDKLNVSWPAAPGATSYRVEYQGEDDSAYTEFARADDTLTTETITGLAAEVAYDVRVTSIYTAGQTEFDGDSAVGKGATPPGPAPSLADGHAPAIEIQLTTGSGVWFEWNKATVNGAEATHYTIEWSKKQAGPYEDLDNPSPLGESGRCVPKMPAWQHIKDPAKDQGCYFYFKEFIDAETIERGDFRYYRLVAHTATDDSPPGPLFRYRLGETGGL